MQLLKNFWVWCILLLFASFSLATITGTVLYPQNQESIIQNTNFDVNVQVVGNANENTDFNLALWWTLWYSNSAGAKTNQISSQKLYEVISPDQNSNGWVWGTAGEQLGTFDALNQVEGSGSWSWAFPNGSGLYYSFYQKYFSDTNLFDINKNGGGIVFYIKTNCLYCLANANTYIQLQTRTATNVVQLGPFTAKPDSNNTWKRFLIDLNSFDNVTPSFSTYKIGFVRFGQYAVNPVPKDFNIWIDGIKFYDSNCPAFDGNVAKNTQCKKTTSISTTGNYYIDANISNMDVPTGTDSFDSGNDYFTIAAADTCTCPASGDWEIKNGDICSLINTCTITGNFKITSGSLTITSTGKLALAANTKIIIEKAANTKLVIEKNGKIIKNK